MNCWISRCSPNSAVSIPFSSAIIFSRGDTPTDTLPFQLHGWARWARGLHDRNGTSVLTPTFRYNPAIVAQAFATLGAMFPKRVVLGVGTGESLNEVPASGMSWPEPKERTARLKEALALIRQLWTEPRVSFTGQLLSNRKGNHLR